MKCLIMAGGSGTRLWPLSRKNYPKQFLKLNEEKSLFQQTLERVLLALSLEDIVIMTNSEYKFYVLSELNSLRLIHNSAIINNLILEPTSRNTAPAIALGIRYCLDKLGCSNDEVVFVCPSDHVIKPNEKFTQYITTAGGLAKEGYIVTFGIKPDKPETGYGYIKGGEVIGNNKIGYRVERFTEKPDEETAKRYINEGNYYWNSGMFTFTIGTMREELSKYTPGIGGMLNRDFDDMLSNFSEMPNISIDYAVMEKSDKAVVLPLDLYWNDIGSWDALYDVLEKDQDGNPTRGDVLTINTEGTLIFGNKRLISTINLNNLLIVETDDAILIAKRGETQKVKMIVDKLNKLNRKEALEHLTIYRPWGSYTVLEEGPRYKIKRIVVNPKEKLSLQMHHHRSEHWVVIKGTAKVTIGDKEMYVHENESTYVPKSTLHRLENQGKIPLEIIEVQNGEYVEEDDIIRVEDSYGR